MTVGDYTISLTDVTLSDDGFEIMPGFYGVPPNMTDSDTILIVLAKLESGGSLSDFTSLPTWITDETGGRYDAGPGASQNDTNTAIWLWAVPKTSTSFVLWFPSGEIIDLSPLL